MHMFENLFMLFLIISFIVQWIILYRNHYQIQGLKMRILQRNLNAFYFSFQSSIYALVYFRHMKVDNQSQRTLSDDLVSLGIPQAIVDDSQKLLYFLKLSTGEQSSVQGFYQNIRVVDQCQRFKFEIKFIAQAVQRINDRFMDF